MIALNRMSTRLTQRLFAVAFLGLIPSALLASDGLTLAVNGGLLNVTPITAQVIRVAFSKDRQFFDLPSLAVLPQKVLSHDNWKLQSLAAEWIISTESLQIHINRKTSAVSFFDAKGQTILSEVPGGRTLDPAHVQGEDTFHVRQQWVPNGGSLYGLGQNQLGLLDLKGYDLDLWQHNTSIAVPFLSSSKGYGILWDNPSFTKFGDLRPFVPIPSAHMVALDGRVGGLTATYFSGANFEKFVGSRRESKVELVSGKLNPDLPRGPFCVRWQSTVLAPVSGDYQFQAYSHSGFKVWISYGLLMNHWRQSWLPWYDVAKVHLVAGQKVQVKIEYQADQGQPLLQFNWKTPSVEPTTSLWSEVGEGTNYYFAYGPGMDQVIAGYRQLTGQASMMPRWSFGLFQSRQRYENQRQSLDVVNGFRSRGIPFDTIVQDWFYWNADEWGSHQFDLIRFPDPSGWIRAIHDKHAHLMISVWPKFYPGTANFNEMNARGFLFQPNLREGLKDWTRHAYTFYDAFNPEARQLFWKQASRALLSKKVDAWWMDASEPDLLPSPTLEGTKTHMNPTAKGSGSRVLNAYPLVNAQAIYEGQRQDAPDKRVFILTRSGYSGLQRLGTAVWSGDISSTWTAMRKQIAAGLSVSLSGLPYWTMDSGGFSVPGRFSSRNRKAEDSEEWAELNARWFEFAAFTPFLRVHGESPFREMWQFGGDSSPTFAAQLKSDKLRYMLMPYIYSVSATVNRQAGTIMRPLVMDFPNDLSVRNITDQYMFGPSLMVNPVTSYRVRKRMVYFPDSPGGWYDLANNKWHESGQTDAVGAPFDTIPLFAKAGAILPTGREIQYASQDPEGPITLTIWAGADGRFTLYDDDGVSYRYEKGEYSTIPMAWNNSRQELTLGARKGVFQGMRHQRQFSVFVITKSGPKEIRKVVYDGKRLVVPMP